MALLTLLAFILLQEPFLCVFNLLLDFALNDVHVLPLANLYSDFLLKLEHGLSDDLVVKVNHVRLNLSVEIRKFVHNRLHIRLAEPVPFQEVQCLEVKLRFVAEEVLVAADDRLFLKFDMEVLLVALLEADRVTARGHVDLLVDFFALLKDELFRLVKSRLELLEGFNHELLVLSVFPGVKDALVWGTDAVLFKELEVGPEQVDEVFKEEFLVNVPPDVLGKLLHETLVFV